MAEYIEREEYCEKHCRCDSEYCDKPSCPIWKAPAADVAPVVHGHWDKNGRCTACGGHAPFWCMASTYYKSPFCHECGAKMDKGDKT